MKQRNENGFVSLFYCNKGDPRFVVIVYNLTALYIYSIQIIKSIVDLPAFKYI